ncbi:glycosyltransferase [Empedobacter sp. UBA7620]|uniref:glycosyltransferase n=1 Tax=Empedobacter sp. UBA7620 TaxID=1946452 RepID=UPI0025C57266|nr:glycosyltransferase [Empedobacter sp. UBA7620]
MKVLMINSVSGYGSTGSICEDIANVLEQQGHECYIAYGQLSTSYHKSFKIGTRIENHLHNVGRRLIGKQGYYTKRGTTKLIDFIKEYNPDVIHLHNLHGNYLNLEILFDFLNLVQKRVIWTLHDCWAFTGRCAYYSDLLCDKWKTECSHCPQFKTYLSSVFLDKSQEMHRDKKKWFTKLEKATIHTVSNWLAGEVKQSLLNCYEVKPIYNWINHSIFRPVSDDSIIDQYNLNSEKFTIICVSAQWSLGTVRYNDLIKFAKEIGNDYQIIVVGKVAKNCKFPKNCKVIPYVDGKSELAKLYNFADVYVHFSTEDTFGLVIAEAMSCGTPVVVNNVTACPEVVGEGCGYVIKSRDNLARINAVKTIEKNGKSFYSEKCRAYVLEHYDITININEIINLYKNKM